MTSSWISRVLKSFSITGLVTAAMFFVGSMTPSLLPRSAVMQGVLSGCALAAGYGVGTFLRWLWSYLELPLPGSRAESVLKWVLAGFCATAILAVLWRAADWQNSIRAVMGLDPIDRGQLVYVAIIALGTFGLLLLIARLFLRLAKSSVHWLQRFIPRRVSHVLGILVALAIFWALIDGVLFRLGLRAADFSYQRVNAMVESGARAPTDPMKTGSAASLIAWKGVGNQGRGFVFSGPTAGELGAFFGHAAPEPLRVFVGLNSAKTVQARARLALDELKRVGGFERAVLLIITPTGSGWVDSSAVNTLEYLHRGDVASVVVQYSYLPSWLSLLVEPGYGSGTARALFGEIYAYWKTLPADRRPRLYVYGLSLGALNSQLSADILDVVADPHQGALWAGPPFASEAWRRATQERNPGSPAWLPRFRDGSIIRFTSQSNALDIPGAQWGPMRIVYLQYASDPIVFFETQSFYREPEWMKAPRGPDVSPRLRWLPVVTMLQLAVDMVGANAPAAGHGHVYAPEHYIDAWLAVTNPSGWTQDEVARLKRSFAPLKRPAPRTP